MISAGWIAIVLAGLAQAQSANDSDPYCLGTWLSPLPNVVYRNAALRMHISSGLCKPGPDVKNEAKSVFLENESEPIDFYLTERNDFPEMFHDWVPVDGWGTRMTVGFPLVSPDGTWGYPERGAPDSPFIHVEVLDEPAPSPEIESIEFVGFTPSACEGFQQEAILRVTPAVESHIYWVTASDETKSVTMPFMLGGSSGEFLLYLLFRELCGIQDPPSRIFEGMNYEDSKITIQAENTAGDLGEPVGVATDSGGCGCSTVQYGGKPQLVLLSLLLLFLARARWRRRR